MPNTEYPRSEKVHNPLAELEKNVIEMKGDVKHLLEKVDSLSETISHIDRWKNGHEGQPGVNVRIDRIERFMAVCLWTAGIAAGVAIASGTAQILWVMKNTPPSKTP